MACRVAAAAPHAGKSGLRSYSSDARACSCEFVATSAARLKISELIRRNSNAITEHARLNRSADFRLRGVLGMVAGVRKTACHQRSAYLGITGNTTCDG
jgi:hypothetical protein